jgi:hypothetical protein
LFERFTWDDHSLTSDQRLRARLTERAASAFEALNGEEVGVVVVPEFSRRVDDDAFAIHAAIGPEWPGLLVAGSAHCVVDGVNANSAVTLLGGAELLRSNKFEPYIFRDRSSRTNHREDIHPQPTRITLACGTATRLGVVVCSDLNSA